MKIFTKKHINFDHNAIEMPSKHVLKTIERLYAQGYANPNANYLDGRKAMEMIEKAREKVAIALGCQPNEIFFTSGASESIAWIAKNFSLSVNKKSHHSMIEAEKNQRTFETKNKIISFPLIVSETGENLKNYYNLDLEGTRYFVDLTQAIGKIPINLAQYPHIKFACASGQKIGGISGCGILYIKEEFNDKCLIKPLIYGSQENEYRGGTYNVPAIVAFGEAIEEITNNMSHNISIRGNIINEIVKGLKKLKVTYRIHTNVINITFNQISAATAVELFDHYGFNISAGSACNSGDEEPSQAYLESGYTEEQAMKTVRISIGCGNKLSEAKKFVKILKKILDNYDK